VSDSTQLPQEVDPAKPITGDEYGEPAEQYDERGRPLHDRRCQCSRHSSRKLPDDVLRAWCGDCGGWIRGGPIPVTESRFARKRRIYREAGVTRPTAGRPKKHGPCKNDHSPHYRKRSKDGRNSYCLACRREKSVINIQRGSSD